MPDSNPKTKTHYDQLGVKPTASPQQIRRAFRDLSKLYHPDTTELPAAEATEKFQQLNDAYAILSSPDRRWAYDQQVGYSRISVMQPLEPLRQSPVAAQRREPANMYLDPTDRPLSAGEIFALFILGLTFVACLALVITVSLTRGEYAAKLVGPDLGPNLETPLEQSIPNVEVSAASQTHYSELLPEAAPALPTERRDIHPSAASPPKWL
ncbi:molecular chaperone DnaJ [filamentous cyanobacterium CCP3]|nr:molecular chaperone DnaJ [filamentous cyanobacterium CCP3]